MDSAAPLKPAALARLRRALLRWYDQHRRELPWRADTDPYRVWLSEIMLQQTRVEAMREHYARFLQRFPTVQTLARARVASVLAIWSGLGYYYRARRMHEAAKLIVRERQGNFPRTMDELRQLPGIGQYTAAAVASIAFGEPVAVVDGNVERVLARLFAPGALSAKKRASQRTAVWKQAQLLLDRRRPGDFNQAMMELGATICTPRAPQCLLCPVHEWCAARGKQQARPQPRRKRRRLCYGLARQNGSVLLMQRAADASLMAGMWELPSIDDDLPTIDGTQRKHAANFRHSITDTDYEISVHEIEADSVALLRLTSRTCWFERRQWQRLPLTGLARKILLRLAT